MRIAINRYFARKGKVWIRIFPDKPISKKPAETRMGKGKGAPAEWVAIIRPGRILFEVGNVSREDAQNALRLAAGKLGIRTRFVERVELV
jgi:large subunit ribosomal protein L16